MLNPSALKIIPKGKTEIILPRYQDYCFANLPPTILKLFDCHHSNPTLPQDAFPYPQKNQPSLQETIQSFSPQDVEKKNEISELDSLS